MRWTALLVVGLAFAVRTVATRAEEPGVSDPAELRAEILERGPRTVLRRLWSRDQEFERACAQIATGDSQWLEVARLLKPASDAAASLSLRFSVARALPAAPREVLGLVGRGFTLRDLCTSPFIEPEPGSPRSMRSKRLRHSLSSKVPSLRLVHKSALREFAFPARNSAALGLTSRCS